MRHRSFLTTAVTVVLTILLPITSSASANDASRYYVSLAKLDSNKAADDANRDFANGVCILYATGGYTWMLLGTKMNVYDAKSKYVIFYDTQTSDVISEETADTQRRARAYAEAYNKTAVKNCGVK
jgi:hypothetical protein